MLNRIALDKSDYLGKNGFGVKKPSKDDMP